MVGEAQLLVGAVDGDGLTVGTMLLKPTGVAPLGMALTVMVTVCGDPTLLVAISGLSWMLAST